MTIKTTLPDRTPYEQTLWGLISACSSAELAVAADALEMAADRLDDPDHWCRYDEAQLADGTPTTVYDTLRTGALSPNAETARACALGHLKVSLVRAAGYHIDRYQPGWTATRPFIRLAIIKRAQVDADVRADDTIPMINDILGRDTVQWVLRCAANTARGELNARLADIS